MTALRTAIGFCKKYAKVLKKKLARGKRSERRWWWRTFDGGDATNNNCNCYENEAVDNMINEFIDGHGKTAAALGGR